MKCKINGTVHDCEIVQEFKFLNETEVKLTDGTKTHVENKNLIKEELEEGVFDLGINIIKSGLCIFGIWLMVVLIVYNWDKLQNLVRGWLIG